MKLTVIYDNTSQRKDLQADWGFSCLVESEGNKILFDTGAKEEILLHNMTAIGIDPSTITSLFISHNHYDHAGGVALLNRPALQCFIPASSRSKLGPKICSQGSIPVYVHERQEIAPHIWSTGEMKGSIHEQSLVIEHGQELILITGCAHPGIVNIAKKVCLDFGKAPTLLFLSYAGASHITIASFAKGS